MVQGTEGFFEFVLRNAAYGMIPGLWFAYIGDVAPFWGAFGGLLAVAMIGAPSRLVKTRKRPRPPAL
jgi:hypothetical protein